MEQQTINTEKKRGRGRPTKKDEDKITKTNHEYYAIHRDQPILCSCNHFVYKYNLEKHQKTNRHLKHLEFLQKQINNQPINLIS